MNIRFSEENTDIFNYFSLYPSTFKFLNHDQAKEVLLKIDGSGSLLNEGIVWHKILQENKPSTLDDMLSATNFLPKIQRILLKSLSLPVTTATIERSFSTLRRVKTWLRSTMSENRISGLCMLSVHRDVVKKEEDAFVPKVLDKFGESERRLLLLFSEDD